MWNNFFKDWDDMLEYRSVKKHFVQYIKAIQKFTTDCIDDATTYSREQYNKFKNKNWTDE